MNDQKVTSLPPLSNRYEADPALRQIIGRLQQKSRTWAEPVLQRMGELSATQLPALADAANKQTPRLTPFDKFGNHIDEVVYDDSYKRLREHSYGEGIIGNYYNDKVRETLGSEIEIVKFAQGYLFAQSEQGLYCPICMTDGLGFLVEKYGSASQKKEFLPHLTSTQPDGLWEGAMFLTEKAGGSDVGATQTIAREVGDGTYALYGEKWFCSNASAEAAAVLARVDSNKPGTQGLGLFLMRKHRDDGTLNNQRIERLKDKLGTRSMPTGEITLDGAIAAPLGDLDRGFVQMTDMLNLCRLYNANASVAVVRSVFTEALRYCHVRNAFNRPLASYPLVQDKLSELAVELEAAVQTLFWVHGLRGKMACDAATESEVRLLRIMTPLLKYRTAKLAVRSASDCIELHGGNGYIEDWPLARFFRDAQVLPVWEGTTNMMVLDAVRASSKDQAHQALFEYIGANAHDERLVKAMAELRNRAASVIKQAATDIFTLDVSAKQWCDLAFECAQAATLLSVARDARSQALAEQFLSRHFAGDAHDYISRTSRDFQLLTSASSVGCSA